MRNSAQWVTPSVRRAAAGDQLELTRLLTKHLPVLRRQVARRLDRRLQARLGASDILQEAALHAARRLPQYVENPSSSFLQWLRAVTHNTLLALHRRHLSVGKRSAHREVSLNAGCGDGAWPEKADSALARESLQPSQSLTRSETQQRIRQALDRLDPADREVLVARHFDQLSNIEAAEKLRLTPGAASKRHSRALLRLRQLLDANDA